MRSHPYCMHMSLWVFSPVNAVNDALRRYVESLGFDVVQDPATATAALFDLSSAGSNLPPAPAVPCVALLGAANSDMLDDAYRAGYAVHLPGDDEDRLRSKLATLLGGGTIGDGVAPKSPTASRGKDAPQLTPREAQVMSLLMLGLTNKRIAKHLVITERTVKFHVASLMRKHGVNNRTKLMLKNPIVVKRLFAGSPSRRA